MIDFYLPVSLNWNQSLGYLARLQCHYSVRGADLDEVDHWLEPWVMGISKNSWVYFRVGHALDRMRYSDYYVHGAAVEHSDAYNGIPLVTLC